MAVRFSRVHGHSDGRTAGLSWPLWPGRMGASIPSGRDRGRVPEPALRARDAVRRTIDSPVPVAIARGTRRGRRPAAFPPLLPPPPPLLFIRETQTPRLFPLSHCSLTVYLSSVRYRTHNTVPSRISLAHLYSTTNAKNTEHNGRRCSRCEVSPSFFTGRSLITVVIVNY